MQCIGTADPNGNGPLQARIAACQRELAMLQAEVKGDGINADDAHTDDAAVVAHVVEAADGADDDADVADADVVVVADLDDDVADANVYRQRRFVWTEQEMNYVSRWISKHPGRPVGKLA